MDSTSQYAPIWEKLKKDKQVSITANRALHSRILKAVTKLKWLDLGYKIEIDPDHAILSHSRNYAILTFVLEVRKAKLDFRTRGPITVRDI